MLIDETGGRNSSEFKLVMASSAGVSLDDDSWEFNTDEAMVHLEEHGGITGHASGLQRVPF